MKINLLKLCCAVAMLFSGSITSQAKSNFLIQRTYEELVDSAIVKSDDYALYLNTNLSKSFKTIYDDLQSQNSARVTNRINSLIGKPLRSSALVGFKTPYLYNLGYFHSYSVYALAQNPVFPNIDAFMSSSHNFWFRREFKIDNKLVLDVYPILGFQKTVSAEKELAEVIDSGLDLNLSDAKSRFFTSLNFSLKYPLKYLDVEIENYNYFLDENDKYSTFLKLTSYAQISTVKLSFSGRYRAITPRFLADEKKLDFIAKVKYKKMAEISLSYTELKFLNTSLTFELLGLKTSLAYRKASLDFLRQQVSENYEFGLSYQF